MSAAATNWTLPGQEYGPWEALAMGNGVRTHWRRGDQTRPGFMVADLNGCPLDRKADIGNLIAAAPDLYTALDGLLGLWRRSMEPPHLGGGVLPADTAIALANAEAALAKARGETPC